MPVPIGVFRSVDRPTFDDSVHNQMALAQERRAESIQDLLESGETWDVK